MVLTSRALETFRGFTSGFLQTFNALVVLNRTNNAIYWNNIPVVSRLIFCQSITKYCSHACFLGLTEMHQSLFNLSSPMYMVFHYIPPDTFQNNNFLLGRRNAFVVPSIANLVLLGILLWKKLYSEWKTSEHWIVYSSFRFSFWN